MITTKKVKILLAKTDDKKKTEMDNKDKLEMSSNSIENKTLK